MSESGIDIERCLLGIDDEKTWTPKITWTNCSEKMPPDDDKLSITRNSSATKNNYPP